MRAPGAMSAARSTSSRGRRPCGRSRGRRCGRAPPPERPPGSRAGPRPPVRARPPETARPAHDHQPSHPGRPGGLHQRRVQRQNGPRGSVPSLGGTQAETTTSAPATSSVAFAVSEASAAVAVDRGPATARSGSPPGPGARAPMPPLRCGCRSFRWRRRVRPSWSSAKHEAKTPHPDLPATGPGCDLEGGTRREECSHDSHGTSLEGVRGTTRSGDKRQENGGNRGFDLGSAARTHRAPDVFDARTHAVAKWAVPSHRSCTCTGTGLRPTCATPDRSRAGTSCSVSCARSVSRPPTSACACWRRC